jgi:hypothetical protein
LRGGLRNVLVAVDRVRRPGCGTDCWRSWTGRTRSTNSGWSGHWAALMASLVSQAQDLDTFTDLFPGRGRVPAVGSACGRRGVPGARDDGGRVRSFAGFNILVKSRWFDGSAGSVVPGAEGSGAPWRLVGECMQPDSLRHAAVEERMPTIPVCLGGLTVRRPRWCRGGCRSTCGPAACHARPLAGQRERTAADAAGHGPGVGG